MLRLGFGGGLGFLGEGFYGLVDLSEGFFRHLIDEKNPVEVVGLVLDAAGEQVVAAQHVRHAVFVLKFYGDGDGTFHIPADFRK